MEEFKCILPKNTFADVKAQNPDSEIVSFLIPCIMISSDNYNILIEMIKGNVVIDIEKNKVAKIPTLQDANLKELNILELGMKFPEFKAEDFVDYLQLPVPVIQDLIDSLLKKELLEYEDGMYKVAPRFKFLYYPKIFASKEKPVKIKVIENTNLSMIKPTYHIGTMMEKYGKTISINSIEECFILYHKPKGM